MAGNQFKGRLGYLGPWAGPAFSHVLSLTLAIGNYIHKCLGLLRQPKGSKGSLQPKYFIIGGIFVVGGFFKSKIHKIINIKLGTKIIILSTKKRNQQNTNFKS